MSDIMETIERLADKKEETAALEAELKALVLAIQGVLGDGHICDHGTEVGLTEAEALLVEEKPPKFANVDYYDLPNKGIPEPLGPAPPPTRTETIREQEGDEDVI